MGGCREGITEGRGREVMLKKRERAEKCEGLSSAGGEEKCKVHRQ